MSEFWGLENENDDSQRAGHIEAITKFRLWMDRGCPGLTFAIYMCCRYGKSDTIRNLALIAIAAGKASAALVVHPFPVLAQQFLEESRLKAWRQRWLPVGPRLGKIQVLPDFAHQSMCDDQWIGSIHIQALMQPMQFALLMAWVQRCKTKTGLPPIIFFDEAHQFAKGNKWGDVARRLQSAGCIVVVLTATPFRKLPADERSRLEALPEDERRGAVRQAAIAAGIVKVPSVLDQLRKLWAKASEADRRTFMEEVCRGR